MSACRNATRRRQATTDAAARSIKLTRVVPFPREPSKGAGMSVRGFVCVAVSLMLAATACPAAEVTVVRNVLGPEGPLYVDGNLYYVAWTSGTLSKWDGRT